MILYTPQPENMMNDGADYKPSYFQIPYSRGFIEVEFSSLTTAKIVRLMSNDLNDYLRPGFQPGDEIKLTWEQLNKKAME